MKNILLMFVLMLFAFNIKAQDKIELNEGEKYNVKIVKKTSDALFVYFSDDTSKFIRKIPLFVVKNFDYKSEGNIAFAKSDSILYANYLSRIETNIRTQNAAPPEPAVVNVTYENTGPKYDPDGNLLPTTPRDYFLKSKNQLIGSAVVGVIGTLLITLVNANPNPNANTLIVSGVVAGATGIISTGLTISSTINLYKGLLLLK